MKKIGIVAPPNCMQKKCPFCMENLDTLEYLKRKSTKMCRCKKCGRIINDKIIVY